MSDSLKMPPVNPEAEAAVLASLLLNNGAGIEQLTLEVNDFNQEPNRHIFAAMLTIAKRKDSVNATTVGYELEKMGVLQKVGGVGYVSNLVNTTPDTTHLASYCDIVKRTASFRKVIHICDTAAAKAFEQTDLDKLIIDATNQFANLRPGGSRVLDVTNVRIIMSQPCDYILTCNGTDIHFTIAQLLDQDKFTEKVADVMHTVPVRMASKDKYQEWINLLLQRAEHIPAPLDARSDEERDQLILAFFAQRGESDDYYQVKNGSYSVRSVGGEKYAFFSAYAMRKWLRSQEIKLDAADLWKAVEKMGGVSKGIRLFVTSTAEDGRLTNPKKKVVTDDKAPKRSVSFYCYGIPWKKVAKVCFVEEMAEIDPADMAEEIHDDDEGPVGGGTNGESKE